MTCNRSLFRSTCPTHLCFRCQINSVILSSSSFCSTELFVTLSFRFPSPAKSSAGLPVRAPGPGFAPGPGVNPVRGDGVMRRGSLSSRGTVRGSRRAGGGRGPLAGRSQRGLGMTRMSGRPVGGARVGSMQRRGQRMPSFSTSQQLPSDHTHSPLSSYDVKFAPGSMSSAIQTCGSRTTPLSSAIDSSVGFNFSPYHPPTTATLAFTAGGAGGDGRHNSRSNSGADLPSFSAAEQNRYINTVPPGFGFDGIFSSDSSSVHTGSFSDINPSLEFGFQPSYTSSGVGGGLGSSVHNVSVSDVKTESLDDDVIFVDDDAAAAGSTSAPAGTTAFEGSASSDVGDNADAVAGAAVQQITRRVTITTNIQGQNVKYEQVCLLITAVLFTIFCTWSKLLARYVSVVSLSVITVLSQLMYWLCVGVSWPVELNGCEICCQL